MFLMSVRKDRIMGAWGEDFMDQGGGFPPIAIEQAEVNHATVKHCKSYGSICMDGPVQSPGKTWISAMPPFPMDAGNKLRYGQLPNAAAFDACEKGIADGCESFNLAAREALIDFRPGIPVVFGKIRPV